MLCLKRLLRPRSDQAAAVNASQLGFFLAHLACFFPVLGRSKLDFGVSRDDFSGTKLQFFKSLLAFSFCFSEPPCSAAVRAQHIRRLPKGEPCVPDPVARSCPLLASAFRLQNTSSKLWAQESFLKCLPPILCSFPWTRTDRRTSSAICS